MAALLITLLILMVLSGYSVFKLRDQRRMRGFRQLLSAPADPDEPTLRFNPAMTESLPKPVQEYLQKAIAPQAPLAYGVALAMQGQIRLKPEGDWMDFTARESIRARTGFLWQMRSFKGRLPLFSGFDAFGPDPKAPHQSSGEVNFWFMDLIPMVRKKGGAIDAASIGRLIMEHIWLPSALLPTEEIAWEASNDREISYTFSVAARPVTVHLTLDEQHRPIAIWAKRHRGESDQEESFGGTFSEYAGFDGYYIPTRVELGWGYGEADFVPSFTARILSARFLS
jgi:hypothetical protein